MRSPSLCTLQFNSALFCLCFLYNYYLSFAFNLMLARVCDFYKAGYEKLKASRKLNWKPHLGTVELELKRANGEPWSVSVTPMQATLAMHFQDSSEWTLNALAERLHAPADVVKRRLRFWVNNGLIEQLPNNVYRVAAESSAAGGTIQIQSTRKASSLIGLQPGLWSATTRTCSRIWRTRRRTCGARRRSLC